MNSVRRLPDKGNKIFVPESIDIGYEKEGFFSVTKLIIFIFLTIFMVVGVRYSFDLTFPFFICLAIAIFVIWLWLYIIRMWLLQEKYFMKVYREIKQSPVVPANSLWYIGDISTFNDITYGRFPSMKVAVYVKVERGTIAGREDSYEESHYDAISDFYRMINEAGFELHQINLMESAGKDLRLDYLDQLVANARDNEPLKVYLQSAVEHIKTKSANTLVSRDYYVLFADKDSLAHLTESVGFIFEQLMRGAYHSYTILDEAGIYDLVKEVTGVENFTRDMALNSTVGQVVVARIIDIIYEDGEVERVSPRMVTKQNMQSRQVKQSKQNSRR